MNAKIRIKVALVILIGVFAILSFSLLGVSFALSNDIEINDQVVILNNAIKNTKENIDRVTINLELNKNIENEKPKEIEEPTLEMPKEEVVLPKEPVEEEKPSSNNSNIKPKNNDVTPSTPNKPVTTPEEKPVTFTFKATFNPNGTENKETTLSCTTTSTSCTVTAPTINKSGYKIIGWDIAKDGKGTIKVGSKITLTKNTTYYAITEELKAYYISAEAKAMLALINAEREKIGVHPLTWSNSLESSAEIRAEEIARSFSHTRPDGTAWHSINNLAYGENIAAGNKTAQATFNQWMNSSGHKANMLSDKFTIIGISAYYKSGSTYSYYWVQLFG